MNTTSTLTARQSNGKVHAVLSSEKSGTVFVSLALCGRKVPHVAPATDEARAITCGACAKKA